MTASSVRGRVEQVGSRQMPVVRELLGPTWRSSPRRQLHAAGVVALVVAGSTHRLPDPALAELLAPLRMAAVALAVGMAGTLDDPTRPHLDGAPTPLAVRQSLRAVLAGAARLIWWLAAAAVVAVHHPARAAASAGDSLPLFALTLEFAGLAAVGLAVAALTVRRRGGSGLVLGGGAVLVSAGGLLLLPDGWRLFVGLPSGAEAEYRAWIAAHWRWSALALTATTVAFWAFRDPARRVRTQGDAR